MRTFLTALAAATAMLTFLLAAYLLRARSPSAEQTAPSATGSASAIPVEPLHAFTPPRPTIRIEPGKPADAPADEAVSLDDVGNIQTNAREWTLYPATPDAPADSQLSATGSASAPVDTPTPSPQPPAPSLQLTLEQTSSMDTSLRNADFPRTYISRIDVDVTSPNHWVTLTWSGHEAASQETGPFHSSPGRGLGNNDCDDVAESNRDGSNCTPKGTMQIEGFSDDMATCHHCKFVTWFVIARGVAFHYYPDVPNYPASHGCVRLEELHAAQLIHNNSKIGETEVTVDGEWEFGR